MKILFLCIFSSLFFQVCASQNASQHIVVQIEGSLKRNAQEISANQDICAITDAILKQEQITDSSKERDADAMKAALFVYAREQQHAWGCPIS